MKKLLALLFVCVLGCSAMCQQDSAAIVIDRYLRLLNHDELPTDSMLYIETKVVSLTNTADTNTVKRWYMYPNSYRTEVWENNRRVETFYNYQDSLYRWYSPKYNDWRIPSVGTYYDMQGAYDFRGPLYHWKTKGAEIAYEGVKKFNNNLVQQVLVRTPFMLDRHYIFEKESGLLFLYTEDTTHLDESVGYENIPRVDWRAIHEFQPIGASLFISVESYQANGKKYVVRHTIKMLPINKDIFRRDNI